MAGWYYYLFVAFAFIGGLLYAVFAWLWTLHPFDSKGWNITLSSVLTLVAAGTIFFPTQYLRAVLAKKGILPKLRIGMWTAAGGPAAIGILWFLGAQIAGWLR